MLNYGIFENCGCAFSKTCRPACSIGEPHFTEINKQDAIVRRQICFLINIINNRIDAL
jgi:hypothetical protein